MGVDQAFVNLIDSNLELQIKLTQEETLNISNTEKIRKLWKDIEACELWIKYLEKNLVSREDEIDRLKSECQSTLHELQKCQDHLELKEEVLVVQDNRIISLEDTVEKLKTQIYSFSANKKAEPWQAESKGPEQTMAEDPLNHIQEILFNREVIANCLMV